jgi:hypothetical protein
MGIIIIIIIIIIPGREVDHSPPISAEAKKMWIYTSTPIHLHGVVLN